MGKRNVAFHPEPLAAYLKEKTVGLHLLKNSPLENFTQAKEGRIQIEFGSGRKGGERRGGEKFDLVQGVKGSLSVGGGNFS